MKKAYHHGNLKESLIKAGIKLLKEKNAAEISLREVAKEAGVSHNAPYRHFKDKSDLLSNIAAYGFMELTKSTNRVINEFPEDPLKQLIESGMEYVLLSVKNSEVIKLMFGGIINKEDFSEELKKIADDSFMALVKVVENGQKKNLYNSNNSIEIATMAWSLVHGISNLIISGNLCKFIETDEDIKEFSRNAINNFLYGVLNKKS